MADTCRSPESLCARLLAVGLRLPGRSGGQITLWPDDVERVLEAMGWLGPAKEESTDG